MKLIFYDMHPYASSVRIRLTIYEMKHSSVSHFTVKQSSKQQFGIGPLSFALFVPSWLNYNSFSF